VGNGKSQREQLTNIYFVLLRINFEKDLSRVKGKGVPLHAMEAYGGEEVKLLLILNLGTRWG
jgi:hypothetical protein